MYYVVEIPVPLYLVIFTMLENIFFGSYHSENNLRYSKQIIFASIVRNIVKIPPPELTYC